MNDYSKQAEAFLKATNAKIYKTYAGFSTSFFGQKDAGRAIWGITIKRDNKTISFKFGNSIMAGCERPTNYDILACVSADSYCHGITYDDFICEYGYEDSKKTEKLYKKCFKHADKINYIFGDVLDALRNII